MRNGTKGEYNSIKPRDELSWIDEVAVVVARKHAQMAVTTGSVDNLKFLRGAYLKDTIVITGKPTHVGNCSMEIKVETYVQHIDGAKELINRAFLTLVGLDENDRPARLPRLILETDEDRAGTLSRTGCCWRLIRWRIRERGSVSALTAIMFSPGS